MQNICYDDIEKEAAARLIPTADVFCLQEVTDYGRPFLKALKENGFSLLHVQSSSPFSTAIAVKTSLFSGIQNHSINLMLPSKKIYDAAIATFKDKTGQRFCISSLGLPRYMETSNSERREGISFCENIMNRLTHITTTDTPHIVCANMVIDLGYFLTAWLKSFNLDLIKSGEPTFKFRLSKKLTKHREVDFIFAKIFFRNFLSIDKKIIHVASKKIKPLDWDLLANASDHLPIFAEVSVRTENSFSHITYNSIDCIMSGRI
jgi:hypothetical protein